jgi:hypothetical protein
MKTYWGSGDIASRILDLSTIWRWVVSFTSRPLYPEGKAPDTHWIGGWVGPRAVLDAVVKRKIPSSRRKSNPRTLIVQPVAQCYTDWAILSYPPYMVVVSSIRNPKMRHAVMRGTHVNMFLCGKQFVCMQCIVCSVNGFAAIGHCLE